jgi:uroporphyrin-III C-methyltransferase
VIQRGTTSEQRVAIGTLADIAPKVADFKSPSIIVVGQVVALSESIDWFKPETVFSHWEH